jgi:hypothetical protein
MTSSLGRQEGDFQFMQFRPLFVRRQLAIASLAHLASELGQL